MLLWLKPLAPQVPFADECRGVSVRLQYFRQGDFFQWEFIADFRWREPLIGAIAAAWDPVGDVHPLRILAGENAGPRRRANRARGIIIREANALVRHLVDVRRLVKRAAIATEIALSEIIDEDEDDIGLVGGKSGNL